MKQNERVIKNALAKLRADREDVIRSIMYGLLEDAVQIALDAHNERHQSHIELGDTYGWMLLHNGKIEELMVVSTDDNRGKATKQLKMIALKNILRSGWKGVVMAGLEPASYFSVNYELGMLDYSMQMTAENFSKYFTKI